MIAEIFPGSVNGEMNIPGSKSQTIRALIIAALAGQRSYIRNPLLSGDCMTAKRVVEQFGASIDARDDFWIVDGPPNGLKVPDDIVNVDNSGTLLYFMTSIAALLSDYTVFTGDKSIRCRPIQPLLTALNELGAVSSTTRQDSITAPFFIKGPIHGGCVNLPCITSQYISSLLLAAPVCGDDIRIETDAPAEIPYIDMTVDWLRKTGIEISYDREEHKWYEIKGNQRYKPFDMTIPSDWSSAVFPVAAALMDGSVLTVHNMDFRDSQGDSAVINRLIDMGADIHKDIERGKLIIRGGKRLEGICIDVMNTPDALPVLCVVGCMAQGTTVLNNVAGARFKETDRVDVMTKALLRMGADISASENAIIIHGGKKLHGCVLNSHSDHRVAMALTIAGLLAQERTKIIGAECAGATFPGFYEKMQRCGAKINFKSENIKVD